MVFGVVSVAKIDHVFDGGDAVDPIFEDMVRLGLAYALAFGDATDAIAVGQVPFLPIVRMMGRRH